MSKSMTACLIVGGAVLTALSHVKLPSLAPFVEALSILGYSMGVASKSHDFWDMLPSRKPPEPPKVD